MRPAKDILDPALFEIYWQLQRYLLMPTMICSLIQSYALTEEELASDDIYEYDIDIIKNYLKILIECVTSKEEEMLTLEKTHIERWAKDNFPDSKVLSRLAEKLPDARKSPDLFLSNCLGKNLRITGRPASYTYGLWVMFALGCNIDMNNNKSPLFSLVIWSDIESLKQLLLLNPKINMNITDAKGETPLAYACVCRREPQEQTPIIELLLAYGASTENCKGFRAKGDKVHAYFRCIEIWMLLLAYGLKVNLEFLNSGLEYHKGREDKDVKTISELLIYHRDKQTKIHAEPSMSSIRPSSLFSTEELRELHALSWTSSYSDRIHGIDDKIIVIKIKEQVPTKKERLISLIEKFLKKFIPNSTLTRGGFGKIYVAGVSLKDLKEHIRKELLNSVRPSESNLTEVKSKELPNSVLPSESNPTEVKSCLIL